MKEERKVAVVIGSLRKGSYSRMMGKALCGAAPTSLDCGIVEIGALPLYNTDVEAVGAHVERKSFREAIRGADAVLFVTPEYNRSVPGALKNAIDVGSRPYGQSAWGKKPAAIVSVSPGALAAFGANHHLRQSLVFLDMPAMQQPEAYIGSVANLFDAQGSLISPDTKEFLQKFMQSFAS